jgi:hypothetical protein
MCVLILKRVFYHKSTYVSIVRELYGARPKESFLLRRSTRDRIVAYLVAVEAWHEVFFGRRLADERTTFLLSATAVCYDDAIDREGYRDFTSLEGFLSARPAREERIDESTAIGCAKLSLTTLRIEQPAFFALASEHLIAINRATAESFGRGRGQSLDEETLRRCCHDKGGHSFRLFTLAGKPEATQEELNLAYRVGVACQLADDIFDQQEDRRVGQTTLALAHQMADEDRQLLSRVTSELPERSSLGPRAFREAWRGYFHDALALYDSGRLKGGWKHDLGQWVFKLGLASLPALPLELARMVPRVSRPMARPHGATIGTVPTGESERCPLGIRTRAD